MTDHESRDVPPALRPSSHSIDTLAREALGARLRREFSHQRPDNDPRLHGNNGPCVAHFPRYPISMEPCSPTCWAGAVWDSLQGFRAPGKTTIGKGRAGSSTNRNELSSQCPGSQAPWFPVSQHGALVEGKLGRRPVDATCPRPRAGRARMLTSTRCWGRCLFGRLGDLLDAVRLPSKERQLCSDEL